MSHAIEIAIGARMDIQRTTQWLRDNHSPSVANRWLAGLRRSLQSLADRPLRHPLAEEHEDFPVEIRQCLHGRGSNKYRIIFLVEDATVVVMYVRHAARDHLNP